MNKEQEIFAGNLLKELGPDQLQDDSENLFLLEHVEHFSANDVHQLIRMLYKKDKEVERLRSTLMEIATKYNIPVDDIDEL